VSDPVANVGISVIATELVSIVITRQIRIERSAAVDRGYCEASVGSTFSSNLLRVTLFDDRRADCNIERSYKTDISSGPRQRPRPGRSQNTNRHGVASFRI
jgi:hypothetical protein